MTLLRRHGRQRRLSKAPSGQSPSGRSWWRGKARRTRIYKRAWLRDRVRATHHHSARAGGQLARMRHVGGGRYAPCAVLSISHRPESESLKVSKSQGLKVSRSQSLKVSKRRVVLLPLRLCDFEALRLAHLAFRLQPPQQLPHRVDDLALFHVGLLEG